MTEQEIERLRHRRRRNHNCQSDASFASSTEVKLFMQAWCDVVCRLSDQQLRNCGSDLQEAWTDADEANKAFDSDDEWELLTSQQYPALLRRIATSKAIGKKKIGTSLDRRIDWLAQTLGLDEIEREIVLTLARCSTHDEWDKLIRAIPGGGHNPSARKIAFLNNLSLSKVEDRLAVGAKLWSTGLVDNDGDGEVSANNFLRRIAKTGSPPSRLAKQLMPAARASSLQWEDFDHIGPQREIAEALVAAAKPCAILLYGPPGTGKTEFAKLLAARSGKRAVFAGMEDDNGREPNRRERLAHLTLLRALTSGDPSRVVVMDEADDVLQLGALEDRGGRSKLFLNRLIEGGQRPTIWIVNDLWRFEESLIRRMSLAIEFPKPSLAVRQRVVERHAKKARLKLSEQERLRLASLPAAPAVLASAVEGAKKVAGNIEQAMAIGEGLVSAISGRPASPTPLPSAYDPTLALADRDLDALAQRLEAIEDREWSLLLSGPSGTGKSAYARHLAERLKIELIERRGSDLLGMYVGETEANIAAAFHEASRCKGLLLIDEADDFLSDRRDAQRSWERSLVNEMLRQMEVSKAPFVATTNLADNLDPATQRRFTIRAAFRALDESRARTQFHRWFGQEAPRDVQLQGSTPGDFALVSRRAKLLDEGNPTTLAKWLQRELADRGQARSPMGF
ncbi:AAA family ATPase [Qipengyuania marisflavi]|uniref:AAA family ATPase n=1 Tax=Qipengyuania marisflavi TaxID=2486356 RepID=A0A5S3NXF5_9SPHN|nr:ATP-binding protein [Qipengyuania marisflavi]TMM44980.1 AAA family ATPase [Qipengyuania marisflavi]